MNCWRAIGLLREEEELLPTFGAPGSRALVDIDDRDAVYAALDAERPE